MNTRYLELKDLPGGFIQAVNDELCYLFFNDHIFINICHYSNKEYKTIVITREFNKLQGQYHLVEYTHYLSKRQTLDMVNRINKHLKENITDLNKQLFEGK